MYLLLLASPGSGSGSVDKARFHSTTSSNSSSSSSSSSGSGSEVNSPDIVDAVLSMFTGQLFQEERIRCHSSGSGSVSGTATRRGASGNGSSTFPSYTHTDNPNPYPGDSSHMCRRGRGSLSASIVNSSRHLARIDRQMYHLLTTRENVGALAGMSCHVLSCPVMSCLSVYTLHHICCINCQSQ